MEQIENTYRRITFALCLIPALTFLSYPLFSQQIVADHQVVDLYDKIPQEFLDSVKTMLVSIPGESHASGYRIGQNLLELLDDTYQVETYWDNNPPPATDQNLRFGMHRSAGEDFFFSQSRIAEMKAEISAQNATGNPFHVMGFGWCWDMTDGDAPGGGEDPVYQVHWAGRSEGSPSGSMRWGLDSDDQALTGNSVSMDTYLEAVDSYIQFCEDNFFPTKWIFTTGPVEKDFHAGSENGFQREIKHDYIRDYVADSSLILFDYADILCWNNTGEQNVTDWDDEGTIRPHAHIHPDNMMDYDDSWNLVPHVEDGDHIGEVGTVRLAKAMWWMLARIAGWDGDTAAACTLNFKPQNNWINGEASIAAEVSDGDTLIAYVEFQYSTDKNNWYPVPGLDSLDGTDTLAADGWSVTFQTVNTPVHGTINDSTVWVRVRACDELGNITNWDVSAYFGIDNTLPSFSSWDHTSPQLPGAFSIIHAISDSISGVLDDAIYPMFYIHWNDSIVSGTEFSDSIVGHWNGSNYHAIFEVSDSLIGDTLYWRVLAMDRAGNTSWSEVHEAGVVQDPGTEGPVYSNFQDDGDQIAGDYHFAVDISDPDGILDNADYPRLYYRFNTPAIDSSSYDAYVKINHSSDSTYEGTISIGSEHEEDYIFWRVLAFDESDPADSTWSTIQNGGRILSPPINHPPTDIYIDVDTIVENKAVGSLIGILFANDEDQDDIHSYELISGPGDTDNNSFQVNPNGELLSSEAFNFEEKASYTLRVCARDIAGDSCDKAIQISVRDVNEAPSVNQVEILPSFPVQESDLTLNYEYSDPEDDPESGTQIRWYRDNVHQSLLDNTILLASSNTAPEEQWYATVQASDGTLFGIEITSAIVDISSAPYCGPCLDETFTDPEGALSDNSCDEYLINTDCRKLIQPAGADYITLSFTAFNTESNYDYVRVYDGPSTTDPLLGEFSGTALPAAITSSGGSMLVHFTSDYSIVASGWTAEYISGELLPICINETFTAASDVVDDNSGSDDYMNLADCQKLIQPPGATEITLNFTEFNLENGNDYVRIYDGAGTSDPLLGEFTGTILPADITSSGGSMLIHFITNDIQTASGWAAQYTSTAPYCGPCIDETFTDPEGALSDNSCDEYLINTDCRKLIQPAGADYITLSFTAFNTESNYDYVRVYDGPSTTDPLLGEFSGTALPAAITSSGGSMLVHFTSDYSVVASGWTAEYTSGELLPICINETFTAASDVVDDNSGSDDYMNLADCQKLIQPPGATEITLNFTEFNLENGNDYVRIYDGAGISDPLLGEFTGTTLPEAITSSGGSMLIHFITNDIQTASGWAAQYTSTAPYCGPCLDETFTDPEGALSDNSCDEYLINTDCRKLIQPAGADYITLSFTAFNTESNYDYVRVYDGPSTTDPLLGEFSGTALPAAITSSGGSMLVHFTSDYSVVASGWTAEYTSGELLPICINETFTAASDVVDDNSGSDDYMNLADCQKLIQPPGATEITLNFTEFNLENGNDYVRIYDGAGISDPLLGEFTGTTLPEAITSSGGSMLIHFITNDIQTASGWAAQYTSTAPYCGPCLDETFTDPEGALSDNSCDEYLINTDCRKLIQPAGADYITLSFTAFNTESNYDYVRVYDGASTTDPLLGEFSGTALPAAITSSGGSMLVHFTSDYSIVASGWTAEYISGELLPICINETFTAASDVVDDNSGSDDYMNLADCQKLIQPPGATEITLNFTEFNLENGNDYVRIYDGAGTSDPLLGEFTGTILPADITSSGGSMLIHFITNDIQTASGWAAQYTSTAPYCGPCIDETFTDPEGALSDNSCDEYLNNADCRKLIQPAGADNITLTFTAFNTESNYDYVRVYDGTSTADPLLGEFTGTTLPADITSSGGSMLVHFSSDYSVTRSGWSANYSSVSGARNPESSTDEELVSSTPDKTEGENAFVVFPNPTNGKFTLRMEKVVEHDFILMITDSSGKILLEKMIHPNGQKIQEELDLSIMPAGIYFIQLLNTSFRQAGKIVVY